MKPQAAALLDKARELLERAAAMLNVGLTQDAGHAAYIAGFHAPRAFLFEQHGKAVKTHKGVRTEFLWLTRNDARVDDEERAFLGRTCNLKSIADYETGPVSQVSVESASEAIQSARRFVECVVVLLPPDGKAPRAPDA